MINIISLLDTSVIMSDSEEDYMSDAILAKCEDKRPGIVPERIASKYKKEERAKELNVKNRIKPLRVLEHEKRNEGLNKAIGEGNKGFSLLQKMGYKPGMALGKTGTGRAEPVPINLRSGRGGLGEDTERKRKQEEMAAWRASMREKRMRKEAEYQKDYRLQKSKMMAGREAESDLYKSQRVCEQLDEAENLAEPEETFFWTPTKMKLLMKEAEKHNTLSSSSSEEADPDEDPPVGFHFPDELNKESYSHILNPESNKCDNEEDEDELPPTNEQLERLTAYLRSRYFYCVWCGTKYDDAEDLSCNCPGDTSKAHDS